MAQKDMEQKIRHAFEAATPDVLDGVLRNCEQQKGTVISMTNKKRTSWVPKVASIAAALALVLCAGFGIGFYRNNYAVDSVVSFDVNPSIELRINSKSKVVDVETLNADGEKVIGEMDLEGASLDVAVNAILGSMIRNGYLNEAANSILVSVNNRDSAKAAELQKKITSDVNTALQGLTFEGAVITQTVAKNDDLAALATQHGISEGKARLIQRILSQDSRYTFEALAKLSVNELNLLTESGKLHLETVQSSGSASEKKFIGKEAAQQAALTHAQLTEADVTRLTAELDSENGIMVYEVDFHTAEFEYEYDINATTGEVVYSEKEPHFDHKPTGTPSVSPDVTLITRQDAINAALAHAGLETASAIECELDKEHAKYYYEVEFEANGVEYDYLIDATNGTVVRHEKEQESTRKPTGESTSSKVVDKATVKETVLAHAGVSTCTEYESELENDHNQLVYEIEFEANGYEYEYTVDALTGKLLRFDKER